MVEVIVLLFVFLNCFQCQIIDHPTKFSKSPGYTLANYIYFKCLGNGDCINQFPNYTSLTWSPEPNSKLWQNGFWQWRLNSDRSKYIRCRQDYYPDQTNPFPYICKLIDPKNEWASQDDCQPDTWQNLCQFDSERYNPWYNRIMRCCAGNGQAMNWL